MELDNDQAGKGAQQKVLENIFLMQEIVEDK